MWAKVGSPYEAVTPANGLASNSVLGNGASVKMPNGNVINDNNWHLIDWVRTVDTMKIYQDGVLRLSVPTQAI